jgi:alkylhydroperoxidase family enzyme
MRNLGISLLALCVCAVAASAQPEKPVPKALFPALPDEDAWGKLPPQKKPALPEWARVLAGPLPKTTAKLLELDYHHRVNNPLGPRLSARLRWEVAKTLKCEYGMEVASADRNKPAALIVPRRDGERIAIAFAKKLTLEGHAITDEEFAELLEYFEPAEVTAIIHTVAYANFHNRLLLGLGVKGGSPVAEPIGAAFDITGKVEAPERPSWDDLKNAKGNGLSIRVEWSPKDTDQLNTTLAKQKERKFRIPLPDKSAYEKLTPREKESAEKIKWNTVSMGYQPEMTRAWFAPLYAFYDEAKPDRVFTNSMFWVVTRTNDCFY